MALRNEIHPFGISWDFSWTAFQLYPSPFLFPTQFICLKELCHPSSRVSHIQHFPTVLSPPISPITFLSVDCHVLLALGSLCSHGHLQRIHQIRVSFLPFGELVLEAVFVFMGQPIMSGWLSCMWATIADCCTHPLNPWDLQGVSCLQHFWYGPMKRNLFFANPLVSFRYRSWRKGKGKFCVILHLQGSQWHSPSCINLRVYRHEGVRGLLQFLSSRMLNSPLCLQECLCPFHPALVTFNVFLFFGLTRRSGLRVFIPFPVHNPDSVTSSRNLGLFFPIK